MVMNRRALAALCVLMVLFSACKHSADDPEPNTNQLLIAFSDVTIPIATVDSVTTTFISGTDTIRKKATRGGSFFSISLDGLKTQTYQIQNRIYTAADSSGAKHMWYYQTSVKASADATLTGPTNNQFNTWLENYFYHNDEYNITFVMAKFPNSPYFELNVPKSSNIPYKYIFIDRNLYKTVDKVKYGIGYANLLLKTADYRGNHIDIKSFASFANSSASQSFNAADFSLQLYNETNNDYKVLVKQDIKF
ncbi:hypothetical protein [Mucilaginibacter sp. KACC 22063]|uniref:hypothetical protein n=1 Tax=Mucilaginibacter sp. KACC 22063 TaxID=3025666 RepID=UPI002366CCCB|nr:hypothetical protein [Mucilaginibacter sp. KACC 22063]WDF54080.1 hypothetical protein PQ461_14125 [Mucilaginibacter sp. KACC 22063]